MSSYDSALVHPPAGLLTGGRSAPRSLTPTPTPTQQTSSDLYAAPTLPSRPMQSASADLPQPPSALPGAPARPTPADGPAATRSDNADGARDAKQQAGSAAPLPSATVSMLEPVVKETSVDSAKAPQQAVASAAMAQPTDSTRQDQPPASAADVSSTSAAVSRATTPGVDMEIDVSQDTAVVSEATRNVSTEALAIQPQVVQPSVTLAQPSASAAAAAPSAAASAAPGAAMPSSAAAAIPTPNVPSPLTTPLPSVSGPPVLAPLPQLAPLPPTPSTQQAEFAQQWQQFYAVDHQQQQMYAMQYGGYPYADQQYLAAQAYGVMPPVEGVFGVRPFVPVGAGVVPGPMPPAGDLSKICHELMTKPNVPVNVAKQQPCY